MDIRHPILTALVALAFAFATTADAKGPRGKPAAKPAAKATSAARAPAPRTRPGTSPAARPGTPGAAPGQRPRPGMMHVKPGHNPNARVTFNVPATTAGSATATRPNSAPRTTAGTATATRPNSAPRDTRRDAGNWRPVVTPSAAGSRSAPRNTRRDAGNWSAAKPVAPPSGALKPPTPAQLPTRKDARPPGETNRTTSPQQSIQQVKSSKNAQGDGRVSTMGQGPKPAADNARQLADYMLIQSTVQQQRAPESPEQ